MKLKAIPLLLPVLILLLGGCGGDSQPLPATTPTSTQVLPTATPIPTPSPTQVPHTPTPVPTATSTSVPAATSTPVPTATSTSVPAATSTPVPTATSATPAATPVPECVWVTNEGLCFDENLQPIPNTPVPATSVPLGRLNTSTFPQEVTRKVGIISFRKSPESVEYIEVTDYVSKEAHHLGFILGDIRERCTEWGCIKYQTAIEQFRDPNFCKITRRQLDSIIQECVLPVEDAPYNRFQGKRSLREGQTIYWANSRYSGWFSELKYEQPNEEDLNDLDKLARALGPSVVSIISERCVTNFGRWLVPTHDAGPESSAAGVRGSGFFISEDLILAHPAFLEARLTEEDRQRCADGRYEDGPFVRTFDGEWALTKVIGRKRDAEAKHGTIWGEHWNGDRKDDLVLLQVDAFIPEVNSSPSSQWHPWSQRPYSYPSLKLGSSTSVQDGDSLLTVHHPAIGIASGGWHINVGTTAFACGETAYIALDIPHGGIGSAGAPIIDMSGAVIAVQPDYEATSSECTPSPRIISPSKLGPSPTLLANPRLVMGLPVESYIDQIEEQATAIGKPLGDFGSKPVFDKGWPINSATEMNAAYEVPLYNDGFTESGFPVAEIEPTEQLAERLKSSVVMMLPNGDCPLCTKPTERTVDFGARCVCTGFIVDHDLVMVNAHCTKRIGERIRIQTYSGQQLFGRVVESSIRDGLHPEYSVLRGDVALVKTEHDIDGVPVTFGDSDAMKQWEPVLSIGHPKIANRSGPFVTTVGTWLGLQMPWSSDGLEDMYPVHAYTTIPIAGGSSGSPVFNLRGQLVAQNAYTQSLSQAQSESVVGRNYQIHQMEIDQGHQIHINPRPFKITDRIEFGTGSASSGASSNYIKLLIERWT